jgi:hypothetical protein
MSDGTVPEAPAGMIRAKDLHALLKQHVDDQGGSGGAMLTTGKGATLSAAGFDDVEAPRSVAAISAHIWAHLALLPARSDSGDLRTLVFGVEGGHLALGELFEGSHFVALYATTKEPVADVLARLSALQQKIIEQFGDALTEDAEKADAPVDSSPSAPSPEAPR